METWVLPALLGLGLAAASGFRTFLPLLMLSAVAHFDLFGIDLNSSFSWVGSTGALVALTIAAVVELLADLIPVVDNFLSVIGNITRPVAAVLAAGAVFSSLDPSTAAIAGLIIGAPTALAFSAAQTSFRGVSTVGTAGIANPFISVIEDIVSFFTSLIAMLAPLLIPVVLALMIWALVRLIRRFRRRPAPA